VKIKIARVMPAVILQLPRTEVRPHSDSHLFCSFHPPCLCFQEFSKPCSPMVMHLAFELCWLSVILYKSEAFWKAKVCVWTERRGRFGLVCGNTRLFITDCALCTL